MTKPQYSVDVYTTHDQSEQPFSIDYVTALSLTGGLLTIECDKTESSYTFSAFHRFAAGKWTRYTAYSE